MKIIFETKVFCHRVLKPITIKKQTKNMTPTNNHNLATEKAFVALLSCGKRQNVIRRKRTNKTHKEEK